MRSGSAVFFGQEEAPSCGAQTQRREVVAGHQLAEQSSRLALGLPGDVVERGVAGQREKGVIPGLIIAEIAVRHWHHRV